MVLDELRQESGDRTILVTFERNTGNQTKRESGWLKISMSENNVYYSIPQHQLADITIDDVTYKLAIADKYASSYDYYIPIMCLLEENGIKKDSLIPREIVHLKEYIKLGDNYYQFSNIYNGCNTVVLTKVNNPANLIAAQYKMIAPYFKCVSTNGDTIESSKLNDNTPVLIANVSGCTPSSYTTFNELFKTCSSSLNIISVNFGDNDDLAGIKINVEDAYNEDFYNNYRTEWSVFDCYLIAPNGKVIDKFDIFDWETRLSEHITKSDN